MPDINKLTEQLEIECYNYPPDLEKMKKLVDMGADVNAVYNDYQTLLGHILHEYIERVVTLNYTKDLQMGTALICDTLCRGELINGRDGRYLYSIVRFFFENGFDMKKKFMCEGKETLYANDILTELENAFHGPESIKTLKVTIQNNKKLYTCTKEILKYRIAGMQMKEVQISHTLCSPEALKAPLKKSGSSKCTIVNRARYSQISLIMV